MDSAARPGRDRESVRWVGAAADRALRGLGLSTELLHSVLLAGETAARATGPYHPTTALGLLRWADTVAALRRELATTGWHSHDVRAVPQITRPDRAITLSVLSGNALTGLDRDDGPQPRSDRLRDTVPTRDLPGQLAFFDVLDIETASSGPELWLLLYHRAPAATDRPAQLRAELSRPVGWSENGHVEAWAVRIVLPPVDLPEEAVERAV